MIAINLVFEDSLSEAVMFRMVERFGTKFFVGTSYDGQGFGYIKKTIAGFNQASKHNPFFVLTDLDKNVCAPDLIADWLPVPKDPNLIFRIANKEVESWLLADTKGFARFIGVNAKKISTDPDSLVDPKRTLITMARNSNKKAVRQDITPRNSNAIVGPNYNGKLSSFVLGEWDIDDAMKNSESLKRAVDNLDNFNPK